MHRAKSIAIANSWN